MAKLKMNSKGRELMVALVAYLRDSMQMSNDGLGAPPRKWREWPMLYSGYCSDRDGCTREGGIFGDMTLLEAEISSMFGCYYRSIQDFICAELGIANDYEAKTTVEPSWEDSTTFTLIYKDKVLLDGHTKAWNFCWETPDEMAESMLETYEVIKANFQKALSSGSAQKAYVVISVYKGIIQGDDGVHVTFSKDKADELQAAADKEMGIVRDADGRYDSDNDVYCLETEVEA